MTYTGILATILSGLEPSVSIALACIPQMRPLCTHRKPLSYNHGSVGNSEYVDCESAVRLRSINDVNEPQMKSLDVVSEQELVERSWTNDSVPVDNVKR